MALMKTTFKPGRKIRLGRIDPRADSGLDKKAALDRAARDREVISELAYRLYAEGKRALLIVLQGMDTSGKDGVIRHVVGAVNPQSCTVCPFKQPTAEELAHDFLWRIHRQAPRLGHVAIFNRSHYEEVLVVRVHKLAPEKVWRGRYEIINQFEQSLRDAGVTILKFFLHISKAEQKERLVSRLADPDKRWKFSKFDLAERALWDDYQEAYEDALTRCNTDIAPWHVIPADRKWHRDLLIGSIIRKTLEKMNPQFPPPPPGIEKLKVT
ncbi:MAG: polyphosphate kinase 2 family protein [Phycisphaerae bacterium]|nr:polyphosphate kinase 2 family protein [Phycisphaerae bacterium]